MTIGYTEIRKNDSPWQSGACSMPGVVPYGPKTIRKYKRGQVAMHRVGMEDGSRDRPILRRLPISNNRQTKPAVILLTSPGIPTSLSTPPHRQAVRSQPGSLSSSRRARRFSVFPGPVRTVCVRTSCGNTQCTMFGSPASNYIHDPCLVS